jgi:hypothetical protein
MKDRLPGAAARVNYRPIPTVFSKPVIVGYARGNPEQVSEQGFVLLAGVVERIHMLARDYQYMRRRLGIYITHHNTTIILINHVGRCGSS